MSTDRKELRQEFMNHVRVFEYADRQLVSLLEIKGLTKEVIQALWKLGIPTADALVQCDPDLIVAGLRSCDVPLSEDDTRAGLQVSSWRRQIQGLQAERAGQWPQPLSWE